MQINVMNIQQKILIRKIIFEVLGLKKKYLVIIILN